MKITDIEFGKNKRYVDGNGIIWIAGEETLCSESNYAITRHYTLSNLLSMNFEEQIDWSKVEVDTKILVSNDGERWNYRHFAKYENGRVYAFYDGKTSWTTNATGFWDYAKLPEGENK